MQGTYHQVSGDGRLYGDAGGLLVTDLTDHDDIRVLSQNGTQCRREGEVCLGVDLYLVDTVNIGLDRILNGDDVHVFFIQFAQCGIQRGGLSASGRSGYQNNSVWIFQNHIKLAHFLFIKSQFTLITRKHFFLCQTHHAFFSVNRRKDGGTDIILDPVNHYGDAAILRFSFFRNIHAADNFQSRNNCRKQLDIICKFFVECAINTETYPYFALQCLNMDIRSPLSGCLFNEFFYQLDNRGIADFLFRIVFLPVLFVCLTLLCIFLCSGKCFTVSEIPVQRQHNLIWKCKHRFYLQIRDHHKIIHCRHIHRICHCQTYHIDVSVIKINRNHPVFTQNRCIHQP